MKKKERKWIWLAIAVLVLYLFFQLKQPSQAKTLTAKFYDSNGREVKDNNPFAVIEAVEGTFEGVSYVVFYVETKNTGDVDLKWSVLPKTNSGTDYSGDLYEGLKNGKTEPWDWTTRIPESYIAYWDTGICVDWNPATDACNPSNPCDSWEYPLNYPEFHPDNYYCLTPLEEPILGHGSYTELCQNGCTFSVEIRGEVIDPSTGEGTGQYITRTGLLTLTITPNPFNPDFDVTVGWQ